MSSGESIEGIALQPALYSADIDIFATRLAHAMKLNLSVAHYYRMEDPADESWQDEQLYDFGYATTCRITVDWDKPTDAFYYELFLPVDFPNEDEIAIHFYGNGIIAPRFLTYHQTWWWFMEQLYDVYVAKRDCIHNMDSVLKTKELVEEILQRLGIDRLIFFGSYQHPFANRLMFEDAQVANFQEIVDSARELDGLAVVDFNRLLQGKIDADIPYEWMEQQPSKVVLLHEVNRFPQYGNV